MTAEKPFRKSPILKGSSSDDVSVTVITVELSFTVYLTFMLPFLLIPPFRDASEVNVRFLEHVKVVL